VRQEGENGRKREESGMWGRRGEIRRKREWVAGQEVVVQ
jgi:hypothetical protein